MGSIEDYLCKIDQVAPVADSNGEQIDAFGFKICLGPNIWNPTVGKSSPMFVDVLEEYPLDDIESAVDVGTSTGILAFLLKRRGIERVAACDKEEGSVDIAQRNARENDINISVVQSDLFSNVKGRFDLAVFNAPATHPHRRRIARTMPTLWSPEENILQRFLSGSEWQSHKTPNARALIMYSRFDDFDPLTPDVLAGWEHRVLKSEKGEHSESGVMEVWQ